MGPPDSLTENCKPAKDCLCQTKVLHSLKAFCRDPVMDLVNSIAVPQLRTLTDYWQMIQGFLFL